MLDPVVSTGIGPPQPEGRVWINDKNRLLIINGLSKKSKGLC